VIISDRDLAGVPGPLVVGAVDGRAKLDEADPPAPPELESAGQLASAG
jgi:hypothetical protein